MPPRTPLAKLPLLSRPTNPAILPIPIRSSGNMVPHSLHKTRRHWRPNVKRYDLPVNVIEDAMERADVVASHNASVVALGGTSRRLQRFPQLSGVKMAARDIKSVTKAGGVEGMLLSRPSSQFTPFGRSLRHKLFNELHRLRDELELEGEIRAIEQAEKEAAPRSVAGPQ